MKDDKFPVMNSPNHDMMSYLLQIIIYAMSRQNISVIYMVYLQRGRRLYGK